MGWHWSDDGVLRLDAAQFEALFAGLDWRRVTALENHPPVQKEAVLAEDILAMVATLTFDLRGLRDRAILLAGYVWAGCATPRL